MASKADTSPHIKQVNTWIVVAAATAIFVGRARLAERQTVDDLFIFLRYARNLAERGEFAFNPGDHLEGTSSVVWTLVLGASWSAAGKLGLRGAGTAKALSLALGAMVPATCAFAVRRTLPARPLAAAVPALALALDADLATWAASGMDTALWTLACTACVALAAAGRDRAAAVSLGSLCWVRPEGFLFGALGTLGLVAGDSPARSSGWRRAAALALLAAAPVALLEALRLAYFHDLVPNTFWAKMNAAEGRDYTAVGYIASALERRPLLLLLPLAWTRLRPRPASVRVALSLLVASFSFVLAAGGDWMADRRLLVVALPLAAIAATVAVAWVGSRALLAATAVALAGEAALTVDHAMDQRWREVEWLDERLSWPPAAVRPFREPYRLDWMPTHLLRQIAPFVGPGDVVAHVDVGELPYVMGDVTFLDGFGLVDREAGRAAFGPHDPLRRAVAREALLARRPAVIITVLGEGGRPMSPAHDAAMQDERFAAGWRELGRVPTWGGHPCVTYVRRDLRAAAEPVAAARVRTWLMAVPDVAAAF